MRMVHFPHAYTVRIAWEERCTDPFCLVVIFTLYLMLTSPEKINKQQYKT